MLQTSVAFLFLAFVKASCCLVCTGVAFCFRVVRVCYSEGGLGCLTVIRVNCNICMRTIECRQLHEVRTGTAW